MCSKSRLRRRDDMIALVLSPVAVPGFNRAPYYLGRAALLTARPRSAQITRPQTFQGLRGGVGFGRVGAQLALALKCRGRVIHLRERAEEHNTPNGGRRRLFFVTMARSGTPVCDAQYWVTLHTWPRGCDCWRRWMGYGAIAVHNVTCRCYALSPLSLPIMRGRCGYCVCDGWPRVTC